MSTPQHTVEQLLERHNKAVFSRDFDAIVEDYSDDALLITLYGIFSGRDAIKEFFKDFLLKKMPNMRPVESATDRILVSGNTLLIRWSAESDIATISNGVDTFIEKDGKIWRQTGCFDIVPKER